MFDVHSIIFHIFCCVGDIEFYIVVLSYVSGGNDVKLKGFMSNFLHGIVSSEMTLKNWDEWKWIPWLVL
jgi:hypothetical protein